MAHWREFLDPRAPPGDYLPWKVVAKRTSLSRTTAWRLQRRDDFPRPYAISPGRVGYREDEVEAWRVSRGASGDRPGASAPSTERVAAPKAPAPRAPLAPPRADRTPAAASQAADAPPVRPPSAAAHPAARPAPRRRRSEHARAIAQQMLFDF